LGFPQDDAVKSIQKSQGYFLKTSKTSAIGNNLSASSGIPTVRFKVRMVENIFWMLASEGILKEEKGGFTGPSS